MEPLVAIIAHMGPDLSISGIAVGGGAAYWIPAFAGMGVEGGYGILVLSAY